MQVTLTGDEAFLGLVDPSVRWNGFLCPEFSREEAEKVAEWINADRERKATWVDGTLFVTYDEYTDVYEANADGNYAIGAFAWVWQASE